jgi:hypothetical protein
MRPRAASLCFLLALLASSAAPQVIIFESEGLKYQTLSRNGFTIMFAHLPLQVREYAILQVAISNGASLPCAIRPEDFIYHRKEAGPLRAATASHVVTSLLERGGRHDVIKLVSTYEMGLYGIVRFRSTSGYEQRRQSALAEVSSTRLKAAAAASAIALVETNLRPGESTDGAVFFPNFGRPLEGGRLMITACEEHFQFELEPVEPHPTLQTR